MENFNFKKILKEYNNLMNQELNLIINFKFKNKFKKINSVIECNDLFTSLSQLVNNKQLLLVDILDSIKSLESVE